MKNLLLTFMFLGLGLVFAEDAALEYQQIPHKPGAALTARLAAMSQHFMGKPYLVDPLGEGPSGEFSQNPLVRFDGFDCVTYVETVLALVLSKNYADFQTQLRLLRYRDGLARFEFRNHFANNDWNFNNSRRGVLREFTGKIIGDNGKPVSAVSRTLINKPAWYQHLGADRIHLPKASAREVQKMLPRLHQLGGNTAVEQSVLSYVPLTALFSPLGEANLKVFQQIPDGAIIEIVRPNWNLHDKIGTDLDVSHLGFVFHTEKGWVFRQASSNYHHVVEVDLIGYLRETLKSPTIKGIAVWEVVG
jgi:hypothetical protein